ncbi:hypothetical protein E1A91_A04G063300v1 [Gossypium mustelinum]|uniref:DWNN domain-containing protein n=1 Tax=Gossypium mustelinum TaxID=34275 RepID=A0A5D2ZM29_GOSMU|nr:hypothetical protein E1A91_A04G063300v1 [Gossypium mustelinum]
MAVVYYKFKSSKDSHSLPIDGPFISLSDFKHQIFASERYGNGNDFDLLISDSKIDQKLANGSSLILTNSFLLIRRVPRPLGLPIAIGREEKPNIQCNSPSILVKEQLQEQGFDFDDFGLDFTSISNNSIAKPGDTHCKETKIDHGFKILSVKTLGKWRKISPQSYVWHRSNVGGHYIHHCPINGDPKFDRKRASNTSDSSSKSSGISYASISTTSSSCKSTIVPLELHCPLCKQVMEDAALTICCFASFCEKCVRDRIVSMETCVCRRRIVVDDILPNMNLRDTINRFLNNQSGTETSAMKRKLVNAENEDEEQRKKTE